MNKEYILCAAIYINDGIKHDQQPKNIDIGFVITGRRHHNCYQTIKDITSLSPNQAIGNLISSLSEDEIRKHQGFITSLDRYADRRGLENNQIQFGLTASENGEESILISENLYWDIE